MLTVKCKNDGGEFDTYHAIERDDGWYVKKNPEVVYPNTPFADGSASRQMVAQLIRKEYDVRY